MHLFGQSLTVQSLPFQQQDQAVGACATTAVWCALLGVCRTEEIGAPTPPSITEAAVRHVISERAYPSGGLYPVQMCDALRFFGFPPVVRESGQSPELLRWALGVYVSSGVPVILALAPLPGSGSGGEGHAVAVAGYRKDGQTITKTIDGLDLELDDSAISRLYIHDDRLGPYARARLTNSNDANGMPALGLEVEWPGKTKSEKWLIESALVPLYPKQRATETELFGTCAPFLRAVRSWTSGSEKIGVSLRFIRSSRYLADMHHRDTPQELLQRFLSRAALSRYVAVGTWRIGSTPVLDTIWDTTDRLRGSFEGEGLLALVSRARYYGPLVAELAAGQDGFGVPYC